MNRRRSSRLNSALDASFQIPLAANSTANNLLLEDDALEHDFFDGFDYTITTPVLTKPSSSNLSSSNFKFQQDVRDSARSDQENFYHGDDYAEEEREVELGNADLDEETPRAKRVLTPLLGLSPTPRARKTENGSNGSYTVSRLSTSISSSPLRSEYHLRRRKSSDISSSPMRGVPSSSNSTSTTPKPGRRRNRPSLAPPSVHSTPVGDSVPSSASRPVKAQLRAPSREAEANMLDQEHAISSCNRSDFVSDADRSAGAQGHRTTLASTRRLSSDPHPPGKSLLTKASKPIHSKHPNSSQRRQSRSRTRSASPSPFSRVDHDAVMLPIQEEDEDLQDGDEQPSISKPQHNSAFSVPVDDLMDDYAEGQQRKPSVEGLGRGDLSSSMLRDSNAESRPASSRKLPEKRSGDPLASQPALKKRKTEANIPRRSRTSVEVERSQLPSGCIDPADANPISSTPSEVSADDKVHAEGHVNRPIKNPIAPEFESGPSSYPLIEPRSELPSGVSNVGRAPHEVNEEPDEVQNFLLRYAKKYGSGAGSAASAVSVIPKKPTPIISEHIIKQAPGDPSSKRHDATPEPDVPDIKRAQVKIRRFAASLDPKGKNVSRDTAAKTAVRRAPTNKFGVSKPRSVPNVKGNVCNIPEKSASPVRTLDQLRAASSGPNTMSPEALLTQPLVVLDPATILPNANQLTVDLPSRETCESSLDEGAAPFGSASADRDAVLESRKFEVPLECPADSESVVPRSSAAVTSESGTEKVIREPDTAAIAAKPGGSRSRAQRPADGRLSGKPSIHPAPKKQTSSELRTDDMFARKKRDNYLQKGLDLTANSSRRHVQKPELENNSGNEASKAALPTSSYQTGQASARRPLSVASGSINPATAGPSRSITTVLDLISDAEDQKAKQGVTPDLECRDHSEKEMGCALRRKCGSSKGRGNEAVIPDSQTVSNNSQKRRGSSEPAHASAERQSMSDLGQEDGIENMGTISGTISERLANFGQKIIDSFGLLSAQTETGVIERSSKKAKVSYTQDVGDGLQVSEEGRGSAVQQGMSILSIQTLSPRKVGRNEIHNLDRFNGDNSDQSLSEVRCNAGKTKLEETGDHDYVRGPTFPEAVVTERTGNNRSQLAIEAFPPSHGPRKRSLTTETRNSMVEIDDIELIAGERNRKRARLSDNTAAVAAGPAGSSKPSRSDESRKAITEHAAGTKNDTRSLLASGRTKTTGARAITRDPEANSSGQRSDGTERIRVKKNSCRLTVPMGPIFTTDVLRQQRSLVKPDRDPEMREKDIGRKVKVSKSDGMNEGKSAKTGTSVSNAQIAFHARELWKPTVPHALRSETGVRQASRKQEFEAKLKTWEERASREASSSNHKLPDFKRRYATQGAGLAAMAARRRELIAPTIPISPHFVVDTRLAERQKFEEARRMREAEAEQIREEQRRAREEEEEREWREARKRTVPRANAVPEWYSQVPKRTVQSR